jgi:hypothetical protein
MLAILKQWLKQKFITWLKRKVNKLEQKLGRVKTKIRKHEEIDIYEDL